MLAPLSMAYFKLSVDLVLLDTTEVFRNAALGAYWSEGRPAHSSIQQRLRGTLRGCFVSFLSVARLSRAGDAGKD